MICIGANNAQAQINTTLSRQSVTNPEIYEDVLDRVLQPEILNSIAPTLRASTVTSYIRIPLTERATTNHEVLFTSIVSDEIRSLLSEMSTHSVRLRDIPFTLEQSVETTSQAIRVISNAEIAQMFTITDTITNPNQMVDLVAQRHWDGVRQAGCWAYEHSCSKDPPEYRDINVFAGDNTPYSFLGTLFHLQVLTRNERDIYLIGHPLVRIMSESVRVPHFGLVERYGANVRAVIIEAAGNSNADGPFEDGGYAGIDFEPDTFARENERGQPTLYYRNTQGEEVEYAFIVQDAYRNIRSAILANKVVYVAGYDVMDENNQPIPLNRLMQYPVSEHHTLGTIVRSRSNRCELVEESCFYMPYGYWFSRPLSLIDPNDRFESRTYGTSFSSPAFAAILASALALAPHKSGSEIVQLAKDCARPIDGFNGLGVPNYLCMEQRIRNDDTIYAELLVNVEQSQIDIKLGLRQGQVSTLTALKLNRMSSGITEISRLTLNEAVIGYPLPNQRLDIATDMAVVTFGVEPTNPYTRVISVIDENDPVIEETKSAIRNGELQPVNQTVTEFDLAVTTAGTVFLFALIAEDGSESEVHRIDVQKVVGRSLVIVDADSSDNVVMENLPRGIPLPNIALIVRNERDQVLSASWRLTDSADLFDIDSISGAISVTTNPFIIVSPLFASTALLDYERDDFYQIEVEAVATQNHIFYISRATLDIHIENVLEYIADTDPASNRIAENATSGTAVSGIQLMAYDENNRPLEVGWELLDSANGTFAIGSTSGVVSLSASGTLDYETQRQYQIEARAIAFQNSVLYIDQIALTIDIEDIVELIAITDTNPALNRIVDSPVSGTIVSGLTLQAVDEGDRVIEVMWGLSESAGGTFAIDSTSGEVVLVSDALADYIGITKYQITVFAVSQQVVSNHLPLEIIVGDTVNLRLRLFLESPLRNNW